jgi:hypothetical protein
LKRNLLIFIFLTRFGFLTQAQGFSQVASELGAVTQGENCGASRTQLTRAESDNYLSSDFSTNDIHKGEWACLEIKDHLADDRLKDCLPSPRQVFNYVPSAPVSVVGQMNYHLGSVPIFGFRGLAFARAYHYTVTSDSRGKASVIVKVHFTGGLIDHPDFKSLIQPRLDEAAKNWSQQSPDSKIIFQFLSVEASDGPDFTVEIKDSTTVGDLYDTFWSREVFEINYGAHTIAHEFGHMMGIPDEYDPVNSELFQLKDDADSLRCDVRHIMCSTYTGKTFDYDYYLFMRRAYCQAQNANNGSAERENADQN